MLSTQALFHWLLYFFGFYTAFIRFVDRTDMKICNLWSYTMPGNPLYILPFWYVHTCIYRDWNLIFYDWTWQSFQILDATLIITNTLFVYQICLFALLFYQALSTTIIPTFWQTMLCEQSFQGKVCDVNARKGLNWAQTKPWNSMNINYSASSGHKIAVNETGLWANYYFALLKFLNVKSFVW